VLDADEEGHPGLRVAHSGRRDVALYFDQSYHLVRLVTKVTDPISGREVLEELRFTGGIEASGIRWPRRIQIFQDGAPFFDLELTALTAMPELVLPR